jgi:hydroxymethylpyrimidine/phosphomethylpyrimidine kinase
VNIILSIAGSDPSGGAGIQADLKTITSTGSYGAAVITAITCQNSLGVSHISVLDPALVQSQIVSVLEDLDISHIKIGMTGSTTVIQAIARTLTDFSGEIILDPVLKSSSGTSLIAEEPSSLTLLISKATVLTPNSRELAILAGLPCTSKDQSIKAGEKLLNQFENIKAICIKGGHLNEDVEVVDDTLLLRELETTRTVTISHPRRKTRNSHGTGCTFASAFSSFHSQCNDYEKAFQQTVSYVDELLELGAEDQLGAGTGPLVHYRKNSCQ